MQPLIEFLNQYRDLGWLFVMLVILYLRHKKVWVDGPTNQATEDRANSAEARLEGYRAKIETQAEKNAEQVAILTQILMEDRK